MHTVYKSLHHQLCPIIVCQFIIVSYHCLYEQHSVMQCCLINVCLISVLSLLLTVFICLSFNVCTYNFVLSLSVFSKTCLILSVLSLSVLICPSYHCSVFTSFCPIKYLSFQMYVLKVSVLIKVHLPSKSHVREASFKHITKQHRNIFSKATWGHKWISSCLKAMTN